MLAPLRSLTGLVFEHRNALMCAVLVEERTVFDNDDPEMEGLEGSIHAWPVAEIQNRARTDEFIVENMRKLAIEHGALRTRTFRLEGKTWKPLGSSLRQPEKQDTMPFQTCALKSSEPTVITYLRWRQELEPRASYFYQRHGSDFPELVSDFRDDVIKVAIDSTEEDEARHHVPKTQKRGFLTSIRRFLRRAA